MSERNDAPRRDALTEFRLITHKRARYIAESAASRTINQALEAEMSIARDAAEARVRAVVDAAREVDEIMNPVGMETFPRLREAFRAFDGDGE